MTNYRTSYLLAHLVPCLAMAGAALAITCALPLLPSAQQAHPYLSFNDWLLLLISSLAALACTALAVWWIVSLCWYHTMRISQRLPSITHQSLPPWLPRFIASVAAGSLSISVMTGGNQALASTPDPTVQITATHSSSLGNSPFFAGIPLSGESTVSNQVSHSLAVPSLNPFFVSPSGGFDSPSESSHSVLLASSHQKTYQPITPLFASAQGHNPTAPLQEARQEPPTRNHHYVQAGETLWSIASQYLASDASGSEILSFVHEIQSHNRAEIPSLDSFIFPGQSLIIPSVNR